MPQGGENQAYGLGASSDEQLRRECETLRKMYVGDKVSAWINRNEGNVSQAAIDAMHTQVTEVWNQTHPAMAQFIDGGRA